MISKPRKINFLIYPEWAYSHFDDVSEDFYANDEEYPPIKMSAHPVLYNKDDDTCIYLFDYVLFPYGGEEVFGEDPFTFLVYQEDTGIEKFSIQDQMIPWENGMYLRCPMITEIFDHPYWSKCELCLLRKKNSCNYPYYEILKGNDIKCPIKTFKNFKIKAKTTYGAEYSYAVKQNPYDIARPKIEGWDNSDNPHGGDPPFHFYMCNEDGILTYYADGLKAYGIRPVIKLQLGKKYELTEVDKLAKKKTLDEIYPSL